MYICICIYIFSAFGGVPSGPACSPVGIAPLWLGAFGERACWRDVGLLVVSAFACGKSPCWWSIVRILLVKRALLAKRVLPDQTPTVGRARISGRTLIAGPNANHWPDADCRPNAIYWPEPANAICWY